MNEMRQLILLCFIYILSSSESFSQDKECQATSFDPQFQRVVVAHAPDGKLLQYTYRPTGDLLEIRLSNGRYYQLLPDSDGMLSEILLREKNDNMIVRIVINKITGGVIQRLIWNKKGDVYYHYDKTGKLIKRLPNDGKISDDMERFFLDVRKWGFDCFTNLNVLKRPLTEKNLRSINLLLDHTKR